jgi:hypothetical protein
MEQSIPEIDALFYDQTVSAIYAKSSKRQNAVKIFTIAPDFELADVHSYPVRLSQYVGQKQVVLVFLRGFL